MNYTILNISKCETVWNTTNNKIITKQTTYFYTM